MYKCNVDIESTELLEGKFEDYSPRFDSFVICQDLQMSNSLTVIFYSLNYILMNKMTLIITSCDVLMYILSSVFTLVINTEALMADKSAID